MIISVNSFEEAKAYPVMFNNTELLMDNNKDVFYIKAVDSMGKYTISTYRFEQIENEKPLTADNFVTKQQFDNLSSKLDQMMAMMAATQLNAMNQGGNSDGQQHPEQQTNAATQRNARAKQSV